jgi:AcrR family transcriptional regulator
MFLMRLPRHERSLAQRQERRRRLLDAASVAVVACGTFNVSRRDVASRAGISHGAINHEFETMAGLRDALVADAIERRDLPVLARALAVSHPLIKNAPDELREAARELI